MGRALLQALSLFIDLLNRGQVWKLDLMLLIHVFHVHPSPPLLLFQQLPLSPLSLLLLQSEAFFLFEPPPPFLFLEEEIIVDHLYLILIYVELWQVLEVFGQGLCFPLVAGPFGDGRVEMAELIEIINNSDFGPKKLLFLPFSYLRSVPGFSILLAIPETGERVVELIVL